MSKWKILNTKLNNWQLEGMLGLIPELVTVDDPRPVREQDELFIVFQHAVCAVVQKDGSFDVVRMD